VLCPGLLSGPLWIDGAKCSLCVQTAVSTALPGCAPQLWALLWCFHSTALGLHGAYGANGGACFMVYYLILMLKAGPGGSVLDADGNNLFYLWVDCYSVRVCADTTLEARASILRLSHYLQ